MMYLHLENGDTYTGEGVIDKGASAELVFTTAYTGYEESLTDPSYFGQALVFAYPLIGNYGVDTRRFESGHIQPSMVIAREFDESVRNWLASEGIPAIEAIDTRDLILTIREEGSMRCGLGSSEYKARMNCKYGAWPDDYQEKVTCDNTMVYNEEGWPTIGLIDCGVKESMIEHFVERGACVYRFASDASRSKVLGSGLDIFFVSNGPGDPKDYEHVQDLASYFYDRGYPIAGICLGQQIVALALGGSTKKMKFGHRGVNQPVYDERTERVTMTTQNHSYEVSRVPDGLDLVQWNVNDESPEGLEGDKVILRQYHPEANPGPNDNLDFFEDVLNLARQ